LCRKLDEITISETFMNSNKAEKIVKKWVVLSSDYNISFISYILYNPETVSLKGPNNCCFFYEKKFGIHSFGFHIYNKISVLLCTDCDFSRKFLTISNQTRVRTAADYLVFYCSEALYIYVGQTSTPNYNCE